MGKLKSGLLLIMMLAAHSAFSAPTSGRYFDRVIFILFENTNYQDAIKQPFFNKLASTGVHFSNFSAETHPSQGNYVALTSGSLNGVRGDGKIDLNVNHIGDLLEARGLTWKVYTEDYPGGCFTGTSNRNYARKHNPFISYLNVQKDAKRCSNIVNADEFDRDAASNKLPNYIFYIPNERNDGHDTGVKFADGWYEQRFGSYFATTKFMENTLIISTFDESSGGRANQIYTSFWGPMIRSQVINESLNHYSLLKLVEENWNLQDLGKEDLTAKSITGIWQ